MVEFAQAQCVTAWLRERQDVLLVSHRRPDGDALGALAGLSQLCVGLGVKSRALLFDPFPERYALLRDLAGWVQFPTVFPPGATWNDLPDGPFDGVVIADTCAFNQLEPLAALLPTAPPILVIDHHATRDEIGTRHDDLRLLDPTASSSCLLIGELAAAAELAWTPALATALFVGLATDTGWLRFSNTEGRTFRLAALLADAGAVPSEIHAALYQQDPPARLRLIARLLTSLELHDDGRLALLALRPADFAAAGADASHTEDLVNEVGRLAGIEAVLLLTEEADGGVRANFRSRRWLDVAALAGRFGGGGHMRAAGARLPGPFEAARAAVLSAALAALGEGPAAGA